MKSLTENKNLFPKEICGIITNYCSTFLTICEDIINILPMVDTKILHDINHIEPKTFKVLLEYKKFHIKSINVPYTKMFINNYTNKYCSDNSVLYFFIDNGNTEIVKLLIKQKIFNLCIDDNYAIQTAVKHRHIEIVKLLLKCLEINPMANNNYAIKEAIENGDVEIIKLLMNDERVKFCDGNIDTYIFLAVTEKNQLGMMELLINKKLKNEILRLACIRGQIETIKLLISDPDMDPSIDYNEQLYNACDKRRFEVVKYLLENKKVDPSVNNNYIIKNIAVNNSIEMTKFLLEDKRVNPSVDNNIILKTVSKSGYIMIAKMIINSVNFSITKSDVNICINIADKNGYPQITKLLLGIKQFEID